MTISLEPVQFPTLRPPKDDLLAQLDRMDLKLKNGDVVVVSSKIVSIHQGRCIALDKVSDKEALVKQESDFSLPSQLSKYNIPLTIIHAALIPWGGIDESNADSHIILLPESPSIFAEQLWQVLRQKYDIKDIGVIIADSYCIPLRRGVSGISIGLYGFEPVFDYRGTRDLFGREFAHSQTNHADCIAAAAVAVMGEGTESTPLCIVRSWPKIRFCNEHTFQKLKIDPEDDVYAPLLKQFE